MLEGRLQLLKIEPKKAIAVLKECKNLFVQDGRDLEILWSMIWLAAAYEQAGQREEACTEIRQVMITGTNSDHALVATLRQASPWLQDLKNDLQIGRQFSGLLEKSQRLTIKLPSVRRILRHRAQSVQIPSAGIRIRAFGRAEVGVNGQIISMSDWRTQSVRDLFFYFLFQEKMVTKEQVEAALWPETEGSQALKARFKNEIYRLRRAVGKNVIIFEDEYYCFNRSLDYEYDVETFDSHMLRAHKAENINSRISHLQKAVDLVLGPYLVDVDVAWANAERERLNHIYVSGLEDLAQLYLDTNQLENCLSICQRVLERDQYQEVIYQLEMRAYAALGDRAAIARRYQACKVAMKEGLGLAPSRETELIYRDLTSNSNF